MVDTALHIARRRWPAHLRDDLSREWAAELHAIVHEPKTTRVARAWRSIRYATSLAFARGIEKQPRGLPMRASRSHLSLVFVPVAMALVVLAGFVAGEIVQEMYLEQEAVQPDGSMMNERLLSIDLGGWLALLFAVALGFTGRWVGRWRQGWSPVATVVLLMTGVAAVIALTAPIGSGMLGRFYVAEVSGLLLWAVLLLLSLLGAERMTGWRDRFLAVGGGLFAWYVAAMAASVGMWLDFEGGWGGLPFGQLAAGPLYGFWDDAHLYKQLLLGVTVFALTYRSVSQVTSESTVVPHP